MGVNLRRATVRGETAYQANGGIHGIHGIQGILEEIGYSVREMAEVSVKASRQWRWHIMDAPRSEHQQA